MKKKRLMAVLLSLVMLLSMGSMGAFAAEDVVTIDIGGHKIVRPNHDALIAEIQATVKPSGSMRAPAPPLTALYATAVTSLNIDPYWEELSTNVYNPATLYDHGGGWIIVETVEIGYTNASSRKALLNGIAPTLTEEYPLEDANRVHYGYVRYWLFEGVAGGQFTYQASGLVYPYTNLVARCYIY